MSLCAIIPVANLLAANTSLEEDGFGPENFSVPAYAGPGATHAAMHAWDDTPFATAVKAIAGVVWEESSGDPIARTQALIAAQGAQWGAQAPMLPTTGNALANTLYNYPDGTMWWCIQTFDRTTFPAYPSTYPALIRVVHEPGVVAPWKAPTDQYDAYKLVNPFNGKPDQCTHNGKTWVVSSGDGSGNNVWEPGVSGWTEVGAVAEPPATYPAWVQPTGAQDAYALGAKVSFNGSNYESKISANTWSPTVYPAGWKLV